MTAIEHEQIRQIVRLEVENVVRSHLMSLTQAVLAPLMEVQAEVLQSLKLINDGQQLVERTLADWPDDNEEWRRSLEPDSE